MARLSNVATRIRETRESRGLTQAALGAQLQVTRSQVTLWETGGRNPSPTSLTHIARALGVEVEWLATGKGPQRASSPLGGIDPKLHELVVEAVQGAFKRRRLDIHSKRFTQVVVMVYATSILLWASHSDHDIARFREHLAGASDLALGA